MAGKLPEPVGATRQRMLDRARGRRRRATEAEDHGAGRSPIFPYAVCLILGLAGLGVIAFVGFDLPVPSLTSPLLIMFIVLVALGVLRGRGR